MRNIKHFNKGFAILPVILVVALLAVSGLTTYFVINIGTGGFNSRASTLRQVPPECTGTRLAKGTSASSSVRNWQTYLTANLGEKVVVDGVFGNQTLAAVKKFQTKYSVPVTGYVDEATCLKRKELEGGANPPVVTPSITPIPTSAYVLPPLCTGKSLRSGMSRDSAVTNWQMFFNSVEGANLTLGTSYNTATINAAKAFQRKYRITVDGIIGPQTCKKRVEVEATITPSVPPVVDPDPDPEPDPNPDTPEPDITNTVTPDPENPSPTNEPTADITAPPDSASGTGDAVLVFSLVAQGVTQKPIGDQSVKFQARLKGPTSTEYSSGVLNVTSNGKWTGAVEFKNVKLGSGYSILIKAGKHIQRKFCDVQASESSAGTYRCNTENITLKAGVNNFDFSKVLLFAGDLPINGEQNGLVDAADIAFILNHLGSTNEEDLVIGDLNFDGVIDTQDRSLIVQSLNVKYDDE